MDLEDEDVDEQQAEDDEQVGAAVEDRLKMEKAIKRYEDALRKMEKDYEKVKCHTLSARSPVTHWYASFCDQCVLFRLR